MEMRECEESTAFKSVTIDWLCSNMGRNGAWVCRYSSARISFACCSFIFSFSQTQPLLRRMKFCFKLSVCSALISCCHCCCLKEESQLRASAVWFQSFISSSFCRKSSDCNCSFFTSQILCWLSWVRVSSVFLFSQSRFSAAMFFCPVFPLISLLNAAIVSLIPVISSSVSTWIPSSFRFWFS